MHCIFWFGFPWNTLCAVSDHSEWQSSFHWLSLFSQDETVVPGKAEVLICLFFISVLATHLHHLKAWNLSIQCCVWISQYILALSNFIFWSSQNSSTGFVQLDRVASRILLDRVAFVSPKYRYACEMETRICCYCMEYIWATNQAVVSKYFKCLLCFYVYVNWINWIWELIASSLHCLLWLNFIGPAHWRLILGRSRTSNLCF